MARNPLSFSIRSIKKIVGLLRREILVIPLSLLFNHVKNMIGIPRSFLPRHINSIIRIPLSFGWRNLKDMVGILLSLLQGKLWGCKDPSTVLLRRWWGTLYHFHEAIRRKLKGSVHNFIKEWCEENCTDPFIIFNGRDPYIIFIMQYYENGISFCRDIQKAFL